MVPSRWFRHGGGRASGEAAARNCGRWAETGLLQLWCERWSLGCGGRTRAGGELGAKGDDALIASLAGAVALEPTSGCLTTLEYHMSYTRTCSRSNEANRFQS